MKPDRYEVSADGRRRLSGFIQQRGSRMGMPAWGGFLFGTLFVAVGTAIGLVGTKTIPVDPGKVHAPYWVLTAAGFSFALGGLAVWGMAWKQFTANRQRRQAARQHPNEPALADYRWHPDAFEVSGWGGVVKSLAFAIGMTVFFSIFNWWAFWGHGGWFVIAIVVVFDCLGLVVWWQAGRQLGSAFKFGRSRITFTQFPYRLPGPIVVRWQPRDGVSQVNKGTFTLRCVEEWVEVSGSGKNRTSTLVHEEIWSARWLLDQPRKIPVKDAVELTYDLPPDAPPTRLSADRPVFWELEVSLDVPGLDFKQTYLVPIYNSKAASVIESIRLNHANSIPG
jgi:hypothetical protein